MSKLKRFEVQIQYTGTLTYILKAKDHKSALAKGMRKYDKGENPDSGSMLDWERVDKTRVEELKDEKRVRTTGRR